MKTNCACHHHLTVQRPFQDKKFKDFNEKQQSSNQEVTFLIKLLQKSFISPYKIIYMIDQKQADYFKSRNQSTGCCSVSSITITNGELTKLQKIVKDMTSSFYLKNNISAILEYCSDRFTNIIASGQKQKMKITNEVEKFLIDKVLAEAVNHFIFRGVIAKLQQDSKNINVEIGLWATPTTWFQKYPKIQLNFLTPNMLASINSNSGYSIEQQYFSRHSALLIKDLQFLEKDGKFEQLLWRQKTLDLRNDSKILKNPQKYIDICSSESEYYFAALRQAMIILSSIPFQLNAKANLYCTLSENTHISYFKEKGYHKMHNEEGSFTVLLNLESPLVLKIKNILTSQTTEEIVRPNSLIFINNNSNEYEFHSSLEKLFLFKNVVYCLKKK